MKYSNVAENVDTNFVSSELVDVSFLTGFTLLLLVVGHHVVVLTILCFVLCTAEGVSISTLASECFARSKSCIFYIKYDTPNTVCQTNCMPYDANI